MGVTEEQKQFASAEALQLLLNRLAPDSERAGREYERLRTGLANYFRVKGLFGSFDLADLTLDRVAHLLLSKEVIDLAAFCFGVARLMCLEQYRAENRQRTANESFVNYVRQGDEEDKYELMQKCLETLAVDDQDLLRSYFSEFSSRARSANREKLAEQAGISIDHLRLRIHRLRRKLENCLNRSRTE